MTNVVPFEASRRARPAIPRQTEAASIVFFTGVRYLRDTDAEAVVPDPCERPGGPSGTRQSPRGPGTRKQA